MRGQRDKPQVWVALGAAAVALCSAGFLRRAWEELGAGGSWRSGSRHRWHLGQGTEVLDGVLLGPTPVGRPGSASISRRHFPRAVMLLNFFFFRSDPLPLAF